MRAAVLVLVLGVANSACGPSITSPSAVYTCYTQPRLYTDAFDNNAHFEIDHYTQDTPCPATPIQ